MNKKNVELEYLRAVAILLVLFAHLPAMLRWDLPWWKSTLIYLAPGMGVDLFFCISGYIVTKSLVGFLDEHKARGNHWLAITSFWTRRAFRLMPSAWFWMAIVTVLSVAFNQTGVFADLKANLRAATAILTYTANFAQAKDMMGVLGHYWSLALEEQFYVVLPLFLLMVTGAWRWRIVLIIAMLHMYIGWYEPWDAIWRIIAALWGVLVYYFSLTPQSKAVEPTALRSRPAAIAISLFLVVLLMAIPMQLKGLSMAGTPIAICCAILVWMATFQRGYILPIPIIGPVLEWFGSRSYGLYLTHVPAFLLTHEIWSRYALATGDQLDSTYTLRCAMTGLSLAFLFAEFNYRVIETPLRERGIAVSRRMIGLREAAANTALAELVDDHDPLTASTARH